MKTITLKNQNQALLWEVELSGQVSDGYWENSKPYGHYKALSNSKVEIGDEPHINFTLRRNYNFAASQLLQDVGDRMLMYVRVLKQFPTLSFETIRCLVDNGVYMFSNPYYSKVLKELATIGITDYHKSLEVTDNLDKDSYTMKDLRKDLKEINLAFKTVRF